MYILFYNHCIIIFSFSDIMTDKEKGPPFWEREKEAVELDRQSEKSSTDNFPSDTATKKVLRRVVLDLMQAKYKMEDMTMSLIGLPPLLDQATLDVKRQELLKVIRASHDVIGNVQLNVAVALQETVEVAAKFNTRQTIFDMSNDQSKRIREIKKSLPKEVAPAPYHVPYQQSALAGPSRGRNNYSSDYAYRSGYAQRNQKWAPNVDRCNTCNQSGHRSAMCPMAMNRYSSQQRLSSMMMPAPLPAYMPSQYSHPPGPLPLNYQSPPPRE